MWNCSTALDMNSFPNTASGTPYTAAEQNGIFIVELNTRYHSELVLGDEIELSVRVLDADDKRLSSLFELRRVRDSRVSAVMEQLSLNVSLITRKALPFPLYLQDRLRAAVVADMRRLPSGYTPTLSLKPHGKPQQGRSTSP
jgi:acyl-CoA thioester hydrolase